MLKSSIFLVFNSLLAAGSSYLLTLYLIRNFSIATFGEYSYALLISSFSSIFIMYGTEFSIARDIKKFQTIRHYSYFTFVFRLLNLFLFTLILLFTISDYVWQVFSLSIACLAFNYAYEAKNKNLKFSFIFLTERLSYALIVLILLSLFSLELSFLFITIASISFLSVAYQWHDIKLAFYKIKVADLVNLYKRNSVLVISSIVLFSYGGGSRLILEIKEGKESLAIYSAFWQFVMLATLVQTQFERLWRLRISNSLTDSGAFTNQLKSYILCTTLPFIFAIGLTQLFSEWLALFLFGDKYVRYHTILRVLCLYFVVINVDSLVRMVSIKAGLDKAYLTGHLLGCLSMLAVFSAFSFSLTVFAGLVVAFHCFSLLLVIFFILNKNDYIPNKRI